MQQRWWFGSGAGGGSVSSVSRGADFGEFGAALVVGAVVELTAMGEAALVDLKRRWWWTW